MMSSTNVHSSDNKHVVGGQTIPKPDKNEKNEILEMPPKSAGRGPSKLNVIEGPNTTITAMSNLVVKDDKKVIGRATNDGRVLSGNAAKVQQALRQNRNSSEMGRD